MAWSFSMNEGSGGSSRRTGDQLQRGRNSEGGGGRGKESIKAYMDEVRRPDGIPSWHHLQHVSRLGNLVELNGLLEGALKVPMFLSV